MTGDLRDQLGGEVTSQGHCVQPLATWSSALAPLHPVSLHLEEGQELERGTGPVKEQGSSVLSLPSSFLLTPSPGLGHAAGAGADQQKWGVELAGVFTVPSSGTSWGAAQPNRIPWCLPAGPSPLLTPPSGFRPPSLCPPFTPYHTHTFIKHPRMCPIPGGR